MTKPQSTFSLTGHPLEEPNTLTDSILRRLSNFLHQETGDHPPHNHLLHQWHTHEETPTTQLAEEILQLQEGAILYRNNKPLKETKDQLLLPILRANQMTKKAHQVDLEALLQDHRPLTHQRLHHLLHQQWTIHQSSQIKRNHMLRNLRISKMRSNGTSTSDKPLSTSKKTKRTLIVTKALSDSSLAS